MLGLFGKSRVAAALASNEPEVERIKIALWECPLCSYQCSATLQVPGWYEPDRYCARCDAVMVRSTQEFVHAPPVGSDA